MLEWAMRRLPEEIRRAIGPVPEDLTELRLRAGQRTELVCAGASRLAGGVLSAQEVRAAFEALSEYSAYAREDELNNGYFTLPDGCRVGVCGRWAGGLTHVGSMCLRAARQVRGCADALLPHLYRDRRPKSVLILSPPGLGKTTLLRDIARSMSLGNAWGAGVAVAIADERGELAACHLGVPTLDVGRADVMEGLDKARSIGCLLRAMSPRVIVTDEIGGPDDAQALAEAARCGVRIVASAHATSAQEARSRRALCDLVELFDCIVVLAGRVGEIGSVEERKDA